MSAYQNNKGIVMRDIEMDNYKDDEIVKELVDAFLVVNRHIEAHTDTESSEAEKQFRKDFGEYMSVEVQRVAPKFWNTIKEQND